jgi:hypothetical protein
MGALDLLQTLRARGLNLIADGDGILVSPAELISDEARALIRQNKAALLAALAQASIDYRDSPVSLSGDERAALDRLAAAWGMDAEDRAVMLRQCERGGELADGSWLSPVEARAFWLAEAGAIH